MFVHHSNPIIETDFANVEIYAAYGGCDEYLVTVFYQNEGRHEQLIAHTMREAWKIAYSIYRFEGGADHAVAIVY